MGQNNRLIYRDEIIIFLIPIFIYPYFNIIYIYYFCVIIKICFRPLGQKGVLMKKNNYFETLSTIISLTYKITFIASTIFGIFFWLGFFLESRKKSNKGEEINKIHDPEKEAYDWKKDWRENIGPELDRICRSVSEPEYDDDDRELY